jgi:hypothetical protein
MGSFSDQGTRDADIDPDVTDGYFHMALGCLKDTKAENDFPNGIAVEAVEFWGRLN